MKDYWQNYINGKFVDGGAGVIQVDNPGTGEKLTDQAIADNNDVNEAVSVAKKVQDLMLLQILSFTSKIFPPF